MWTLQFAVACIQATLLNTTPDELRNLKQVRAGLYNSEVQQSSVSFQRNLVQGAWSLLRLGQTADTRAMLAARVHTEGQHIFL
jgi:hypothetical protein